uniref:KIF-binding protein n=1 Tax=Craspedostauros australis TaxID=1486917 RepID=A0A7R9WQR3_9STRA|eukprot:CAMPEP_0198124336 /NCGR_PEP_ID=MMETSP1442-20131203/39704_1 /TAXON_ID= /ORGANISM="Craspedostauros australis, Strain CCMP3328" /LENGTH=291 /DNA_ID=CAMNT_0043783719 /DNA_START=44 /DNA_END=919 /DNA_ORIENTATION=+
MTTVNATYENTIATFQPVLDAANRGAEGLVMGRHSDASRCLSWALSTVKQQLKDVRQKSHLTQLNKQAPECGDATSMETEMDTSMDEATTDGAIHLSCIDIPVTALPAQDYVLYNQALTVSSSSPAAAHPQEHQMEETAVQALSFVLLHNLALLHHFQALQTRECETARRQALLSRAKTLYENTIRLWSSSYIQPPAQDADSSHTVTQYAGIWNNLAHVCLLLGEHELADRCWEEILRVAREDRSQSQHASAGTSAGSNANSQGLGHGSYGIFLENIVHMMCKSHEAAAAA